MFLFFLTQYTITPIITAAATTDPIDIPTIAPVLNPPNTQNPAELGMH